MRNRFRDEGETIGLPWAIQARTSGGLLCRDFGSCWLPEALTFELSSWLIPKKLMKGNLIDRRCLLCSETRAKRLFITRDYNWRSPGRFAYYQCRRCRLAFQDPDLVVEPLEKYYPHGYGTFVGGDRSEFESKISTPLNQYRAALVGQYASQGSLLDVGCGSGFFLKYMQRQGWIARGIEPAGEHVRFAQSALGLKSILKEVWPAAVFEGARLDAISFIHVLEHFRNPVRCLAFARRALAPGGIVLIETPNVDGWPVKLFGRRAMPVDAPRHMALFARKSLRQILELTGFDLLYMSTWSPSTIEYSESLRYLLRDLGLYRRASEYAMQPAIDAANRAGCKTGQNHRIVREALRAGEKWVYVYINSFADRLGQGCNLLAIARCV